MDRQHIGADPCWWMLSVYGSLNRRACWEAAVLQSIHTLQQQQKSAWTPSCNFPCVSLAAQDVKSGCRPCGWRIFGCLGYLHKAEHKWRKAIKSQCSTMKCITLSAYIDVCILVQYLYYSLPFKNTPIFQPWISADEFVHLEWLPYQVRTLMCVFWCCTVLSIRHLFFSCQLIPKNNQMPASEEWYMLPLLILYGEKLH